mmetsp:Transcript_41980/g.127290  ORF Transcript_41980/g.127290 Transcript_41980/m.127290 type:complete len:246 (+) Transcript_41980:1348-2085(+)
MFVFLGYLDGLIISVSALPSDAVPAAALSSICTSLSSLLSGESSRRSSYSDEDEESSALPPFVISAIPTALISGLSSIGSIPSIGSASSAPSLLCPLSKSVKLVSMPCVELFSPAILSESTFTPGKSITAVASVAMWSSWSILFTACRLISSSLRACSSFFFSFCMARHSFSFSSSSPVSALPIIAAEEATVAAFRRSSRASSIAPVSLFCRSFFRPFVSRPRDRSSARSSATFIPITSMSSSGW